jgi:hypothetical protein
MCTRIECAWVSTVPAITAFRPSGTPHCDPGHGPRARGGQPQSQGGSHTARGAATRPGTAHQPAPPARWAHAPACHQTTAAPATDAPSPAATCATRLTCCWPEPGSVGAAAVAASQHQVAPQRRCRRVTPCRDQQRLRPGTGFRGTVFADAARTAVTGKRPASGRPRTRGVAAVSAAAARSRGAGRLGRELPYDGGEQAVLQHSGPSGSPRCRRAGLAPRAVR